jgi:hypothetical protein
MKTSNTIVAGSIALLSSVFFIYGCSDDSSSTPDGRVEAGSPEGGAGPALNGVIKDKVGAVVEGAKVEVSGQLAFSDGEGRYSLGKLSPGAVTVKVTQNWFKDLEQPATLLADQATILDLTIEEQPLKIDPADKALAESYNQSFDWTKQTLSIAQVAKPTRQNLDVAIYWHNPALYRDTSSEPAVTPSPLPAIVGSQASGFTFVVGSGAQQGQEALEPTSIVDTLAQTPLSPAEQQARMIWNPMISWLKHWDADKSAGLNAVGVAVRQQGWGGNALRPQEIEDVYLHQQEIWVKVVFENFLKLGAGVADDDQDGRKEVFAKVASAHFSAELLTALSKQYSQATFNTHGMSQQITESLNQLYSTTAAEVERYIAQPYEIPSLGTINYPFVVLKHSGGQRNVLLVSP